jgi:plastocyanin
MRRLLGVAAVIIAASCGGSDGPTNPGNNNNPGVGTVRGNVNDNTGAPVANATVALSGTGQSTRNTTTGTDGVYTFSNVTAGAYTVAITPPTGFTISAGSTTAVTVVANQQATVGAFVLTRTTGGAGPPTLVDVSMANTAFSPAQVEVAVGGTVRFTNNDGVAHNATSAVISTGNMNPGQVREQVMGAAGTFAYSCTLHAGMNGTVIVR